MKKIQKKSMFFFRILRLIWSKRHKKAAKALQKTTIKIFILTHDWLLLVIRYVLPFMLTVLLIVIALVFAVANGFKFYSKTNFIISTIIGGLVVFWLFYKVIKDYVDDYLK